MIAVRYDVAACALACLLAAGVAAPATAGSDPGARSLQRVHTMPWNIWPDPASWGRSLGAALLHGNSARSAQDPSDDLRLNLYRRGKVSSDFGLQWPEPGVQDAVAMARAGRVKIQINDLLQNDLGMKCDWPCEFAKTPKLKFTGFAGTDNIKRIVQRGKFLYVQTEERRQKATFTYEMFDKGTGATADVQVAIWFGNRAPKTRKDKLVAFANTTNIYDVADLLGNDRDRDGDVLDLVRVWCPTGGRVSVREVDGELRVFFQPDQDFTGVAYFKYTIADLSDPGAVLVAGPGVPLPERKSFAEGIVRLRVLASPS